MIKFEYSRIFGCTGWKIERPKNTYVNPKKRKNEKKKNKKTNSLNNSEFSSNMSEPKIIMSTNSGGAEIFKFTKDQLFLYGEKIEVNDPEVIQGFKTWMKEWGYINNKKDE
ncbi:hypothetical protein [Clostridium sp.]|jgi:hypothetical protein|uniref:hypothetical protein n=1 Tax=Clostridium sp. TaxID=1506 RepID=UPI003EED149F